MTDKIIFLTMGDKTERKTKMFIRINWILNAFEFWKNAVAFAMFKYSISGL